LAGTPPATTGELTFKLTHECLEYLERSKAAKVPKWEERANIIMALECVKIEFYRRMLAYYEDYKILENGDVFGGYTR
jgi:hypothetical protein